MMRTRKARKILMARKKSNTHKAGKKRKTRKKQRYEGTLSRKTNRHVRHVWHESTRGTYFSTILINFDIYNCIYIYLFYVSLASRSKYRKAPN